MVAITSDLVGYAAFWDEAIHRLEWLAIAIIVLLAIIAIELALLAWRLV